MISPSSFDRFSATSRVLGLVRHLAVASLSLVVMAAAAAYAMSPSREALAAEVTGVASLAGIDSIQGRVVIDGRGANGTTVRIFKRVKRGSKLITTIKTDVSGKFLIIVEPGRYRVEMQRGLKRRKSVIGIDVTVTAGHSVFIQAKVTKLSGGLVFIPVIFGY